MKLTSKSLSNELWSDFAAFFEFDGGCSGCWCMNHRLPMGLDFEGEAAKLAMKELVLSNRVFGILVYDEGDSIPVGWCALDRRNTLPGHDCIGTDIGCSDNEWSIHCVATRKDYKNKGIDGFLVAEATKLAKQFKGTSVEGYPEPGSKQGEAFKTWNTFNGRESFFLENGYSRVDKDLKGSAEYYAVVKKYLEH